MSSGFHPNHSPRRQETEHGAYCSSPTDAVAERAHQHAQKNQSIPKNTPIRGDTTINIATAFHQQQMLDDTPLTKRLKPVQISPSWPEKSIRSSREHWQSINTASQDQEIDTFFGHSNTPQQNQTTPEGWNPYEEEEMLSQHPEEEARRRNVVANGGELSESGQEEGEEGEEEESIKDSNEEGVAWIRARLRAVYDKMLLLIFVQLFWFLWITKEIISKATELVLMITGRLLIQPTVSLLRVLGIYNPCPEKPLQSSWRLNRLALLTISFGALNALVLTDNQFTRTPMIRRLFDNQHANIDRFRTFWTSVGHKNPSLAESSKSIDQDPIQAYISKEIERQVQLRLEQLQTNPRSSQAVQNPLLPELHSYIDDRCASRTELKDYAQAIDHIRQEIDQRLQSTLQDIPAQVERETDRLKASLEAANHIQEHWEEVQQLISNIGSPQVHSPWESMADYALATGGASVIKRLTSSSYTTYPHQPALRQISRLTGIGARQSYAAVAALMHGSEPGECWTMDGTEGTLGIFLSQPIIVEHVTMEFPPLTSSVNRTTSPRQFEVWGLQSIVGQGVFGMFGPVHWPWKSPNPDAILLGTFEYDITKSPVQMFDVPSTNFFISQAVLVRVKSNWGNPDYTSLYRIRIHGYPEE